MSQFNQNQFQILQGLAQLSGPPQSSQYGNIEILPTPSPLYATLIPTDATSQPQMGNLQGQDMNQLPFSNITSIFGDNDQVPILFVPQNNIGVLPSQQYLSSTPPQNIFITNS